MKILVLSDSHRNTTYMKQKIEALKNDVSMILHLGDVYDDIRYIQPYYQHIEFHCVLGNCDYGTAAPYDKLIVVNGKKIFMTHGHRYNVKYDDDRIIYAAFEREADICLFGHTHCPVLFKESDMVFLNPGSISLPRSLGGVSYAILDISDEGDISASVVGKDRILKSI